MTTKFKKHIQKSAQTEHKYAPPQKKVKCNDTDTTKSDGTTERLAKNQRRTFGKPRSVCTKRQEKTDWTMYKKKKKELKLKRKRSKMSYDIMVKAKPIGELLRKKLLPGGEDERNKIISQLHSLFVGKQQYSKLVFTHDMARIVQYLIKFASESIRREITEELIPISTEMLASKYGRNCLKSMLKYGTSNVRSKSIKALYGHAVKLVSHAVSASVFEHIYSTWTVPQQKQHLIQEFFGDMYRQSKDNNVKHLRDVYKDDPTMKSAALGAVKANLAKVLAKDLLDSGLVQSVLCQYLAECNANDKNELIEQLAPHVVILSNSWDGVRAVMQCIWCGSNKIKKAIMKSFKEHTTELSKHEHGHWSVIAALDAIDDTVLINKLILTPILADAEILAENECGRKVLLWLVSPGNSSYFHPQFVGELEAGRSASTCKKTLDTQRQELLLYSRPKLLTLVALRPQFWLSSASIAMLTLAILKTGSDENIAQVYEAITKVITEPDWKVKNKEEEVLGIEHPGLHMMLKKLVQHDKAIGRSVELTFGNILLDNITDETLATWITLNRGCFLLVVIYESDHKLIQQKVKQKLGSHLKLIKKQNSEGMKILLEKIG